MGNRPRIWHHPPCNCHSLSWLRAEVGVCALGEADKIAVVDVVDAVCELGSETQLACLRCPGRMLRVGLRVYGNAYMYGKHRHRVRKLSG